MKWFALVLPSFLVATLAHAASFDCAKAHTKPEKMICGDAELSKLDEELGQAYRQALQREDVKKGARESQRLWLKNSRDACQVSACMEQAYQSRIKQLAAALSGKSTMASEATTESVAQRIARLHLRIKPPVCTAVANAVNRGEDRQLQMKIPEEGVLIDINGDGKKERVSFEEKLGYFYYSKVHVSTIEGTPIEFNPVPEDERERDLIDERLINFDDKFYIYGGSSGTPNYLAIIDKDNTEKIVCEFSELKPVVTMASSRDDVLCKLGLERKLDYVKFVGKPHGIERFEGEDVGLVAGNFSPEGVIVETFSPNEVSVDINNDGRTDRVVGLHVITGAANPPCAGDRLAVLNKDGNHLDKVITPLLPNFECMTDQAILMFGGQSFIEIGNKIEQLKGETLNTVCEFHMQRIFRVLEN